MNKFNQEMRQTKKKDSRNYKQSCWKNKKF